MTAKTKKLARIASGVLALALLLAVGACNNELLPTGDLISQGGRPGGDVLGGGGGQPVFPIFDINNLPPVSFWNGRGHYHALPNLFTFANGRPVVTLDDWNGPNGRRWEIAQIIQAYWHGYMPDFGDALEVSWEEVGTTLRIDLKYTRTDGVSTEQSFSVDVDVPAGAGPFPAVLSLASGGTSWNAVRDGRYASIGLNVGNIAGENMNRAGVVTNLFGYNYNVDLDAPSVMMSHAWAAGRIMDALETEIDGRLPFDGKIDPAKLMVTGMSRWGKSAMIVGAFAESKQGTQIAVTRLGSAGAGGPAIERFVGPLGIHEAYTLSVDAALPNNNKPGRTYYFEFLGGNMGNPYLPGFPGGDSNHFVESDAPNRVPYTAVHGPLGNDMVAASGGYPLAVRAISPEEFRARRQSSDPAVRNSVFMYDFFPREGIFNNNFWTGIQPMAQARNETRAWFSERFQQFADLHFGLRVDEVVGIPVRTPDGFLTTIPFDAHFALALIAPRALIIHEGFRTVRNNPEGTYLAHLAVEEVYRFMDDQGVRPAFANVPGFDGGMKVQDFNAIEMHFIPHSDPDYQQHSAIQLADVFFGYSVASAIPNFHERLRAELYPIRDARSKHDFSRLDWARPGAESLKARIADVPDYPWERMRMTRWTGFVTDSALSGDPWFDGGYPWAP